MRLQSAAATDYEGLPTGTQVTLGYNSARINEACGNLQQAAAEYRNILEAFPGMLLLLADWAYLESLKGLTSKSPHRLVLTAACSHSCLSEGLQDLCGGEQR